MKYSYSAHSQGVIRLPIETGFIFQRAFSGSFDTLRFSSNKVIDYISQFRTIPASSCENPGSRRGSVVKEGLQPLVNV